MDTITHALLPVIVTGLFAKRAAWLGQGGIVAIGIAGGLPDLLTPHLSLEARMSSWSHGLPFWIALTFVLVLLAISSRGRITIQLALAMSAAYLLHMLCDAISGGVNFLYPLGNLILGDYWVDPSLWVPLDIVCVLSCYVMFRILPGLKARREAAGRIKTSR